jgi:hypothetical protein
VITVNDALRVMGLQFGVVSPPACLDAADTDDSGEIDISDALFLLEVLFRGGRFLPYPGGLVPGPDPSPDALSCE